jgi:hypothetical protein
MGEFAPQKEKLKDHFETIEELREELESQPELPERAEITPAERAEIVQTASQEANKEAAEKNPVDEFIASQTETSPQQTFVNSNLKKIAAKQQLKQIQQQLPRSDRALSKVVHQPLIRVVSDNAGKTITRPSGLLGGGVVAFLGTSLYVYFTKHIGLQYNYLLFALFFVGGFVLGLMLELIIRLNSKHQSSVRQ